MAGYGFTWTLPCYEPKRTAKARELMPIDDVQLTKFLSFVLRHKPDAVGLALDPQGWASINELIEMGNAARERFNREDLPHVVDTSEKKRFSLATDGLRIRAAQGHSVSVELGLLRCCITAPQRGSWNRFCQKG